VLAVVIHEVNLSHLEEQSDSEIALISTADEASYLRPPQNWVEGKGLTTGFKTLKKSTKG
jgi:hypothetical protein